MGLHSARLTGDSVEETGGGKRIQRGGDPQSRILCLCCFHISSAKRGIYFDKRNWDDMSKADMNIEMFNRGVL